MQIARRKSIRVWISSSRNCVWRDHCQNKLEGSSVLQKVQKVFISAFSSCFSKEKVSGKVWRQKQSPLPSGGDVAGEVQQSAWLQFGLQTAHLNQYLHFHTPHWPTFTSILVQPGTKPKDLVAHGSFPLPPTPPQNVLSNAESAKGAEPSENPLLPEQIHAIHRGTARSVPTWCLMKWREVGGTSAAAAAYTVTVLEVNRGLQSQVCHSCSCQHC